ELATVLIEAGLNTLEHGKRFGKGVGPRKEWPDPTLSNEGIDVARPTAIRVVREPERHSANAVRNAVQADCRALSFNEVDLSLSLSLCSRQVSWVGYNVSSVYSAPNCSANEEYRCVEQ